jgi:CBS domain-containing protein
MPVFEMQRSIKAHASVVWRVICDHQNFTGVAPDIIKVETISGEKLGMVQRLHHKSGKIWEEKCIDWKENSGYTMQVTTKDYPLPVIKMERSCSMEEKQKNIVITLKYRYTPKFGPLGIFLDKYYILPILKIYTNPLMDNLTGIIYDAEWGFHVTAATIIKKKDTGTVTIRPDMTTLEANRFRAENKIGCLMVVDANKKIVGVLSERDIVNAIARNGYEIMEKPVSEIMTRKVITCRPDDDLQTLMTEMTNRRIRHLPVIDGDQLVGVISIGDVVKARMDELEKESEALHNYIKDRRWRELSLQIGRRGATDEFDALERL